MRPLEFEFNANPIVDLYLIDLDESLHEFSDVINIRKPEDMEMGTTFFFPVVYWIYIS